MRKTLGAPAEYHGARLAPTTELAGLAELAELHDEDDRFEAIVRIAHAIAREDEARRFVAERRAEARAGLTELPRRRA